MTVATIARITVLDLMRRRVFVLLLVFTAAMVALAFALKDLTIGQWARIITDLGLGATSLSLQLLGCLIGATLIAGDLDRRTAFPILAKPISRSSLVYGRFVGLSFTIAIFSIAMCLGTALMLVLADQHMWAVPLMQNCVSLAATGIVVGAIAVGFSAITSSTLAALAAMSIAVAGHLTSNLAYFGKKADLALAGYLMTGASKALPNLEALNLTSLASRTESITGTSLSERLLYAGAYAVVVVSLSTLGFNRRDLE